MLKFVQDMIDKVRNSPTNTITVNGQTFSGRNVVINNRQIIVDGKSIDLPEAKQISIRIEGDLESLAVQCGDVEVSGNVGHLSLTTGDAAIGGDVKGTATLEMGDLECTDIYADVKVNMGTVKASTIHGNASTKMGNITK